MRQATVTRTTRETDITVSVDLDGGAVEVATGIGFFDHMLTAFAVHSGIGMTVKAVGDLYVDGHHTVEDTGIVLGQAIAKALGDKSGIARFGNFYIPMDESLCFAALDFSGRPYLVFDARFPEEKVGDYDSCLTVEFFRALAFHAGMTLHTRVEYGVNTHHMIEGLFKAVAHAMKAAIAKQDGVLSTKGSLD
ncbi:MAG: imidazoleglycerol-phosphate dehydratase HisB [Clostridia bacterium]|nr:imidazoleglycerol-phosphate dehydratase HisB [Clostridia bacterium]